MNTYGTYQASSSSHQMTVCHAQSLRSDVVSIDVTDRSFGAVRQYAPVNPGRVEEIEPSGRNGAPITHSCDAALGSLALRQPVSSARMRPALLTATRQCPGELPRDADRS